MAPLREALLGVSCKMYVDNFQRFKMFSVTLILRYIVFVSIFKKTIMIIRLEMIILFRAYK